MHTKACSQPASTALLCGRVGRANPAAQARPPGAAPACNSLCSPAAQLIVVHSSHMAHSMFGAICKIVTGNMSLGTWALSSSRVYFLSTSRRLTGDLPYVRCRIARRARRSATGSGPTACRSLPPARRPGAAAGAPDLKPALVAPAAGAGRAWAWCAGNGRGWYAACRQQSNSDLLSCMASRTAMCGHCCAPPTGAARPCGAWVCLILAARRRSVNSRPMWQHCWGPP